jgi:C1A family cysteine protease
VSGGFVTFNQGQLESCTANCGCEDKALTTIKMGEPYQTYSRAFLWYQERVMNGTTNQNVGANMVDIGDVLAQWGVCYDTTMPYDQNDYTTAPSQAAYTEAGNHKSDANQTALALSDLKTALVNCQQQADLGSVRLSFPVGESFMEAITNGGWVPVPPANDNLVGGHAMLIVGYDDTLKGPNGNVGYFFALQSWGNVGDMTSGLSTFKFPYVIFTSAWVQNEGGADYWQQPDLPSPPAQK